MKEVDKLFINYVGYSNPEGKDEVILEILGLETVISQAKNRIAVLNQSLKLADMMSERVTEGENEETITEAPDNKKTKSEVSE